MTRHKVQFVTSGNKMLWVTRGIFVVTLLNMQEIAILAHHIAIYAQSLTTSSAYLTSI